MPRVSGITVLVAMAIIVTALRLAQDVLMPLAVALLVSFLLAPLVTRIERIGVGRAPAVLAVLLLVMSGLAGVGWVVGRQVSVLAAELPSYRSNLELKLASLRGPIGELARTAEEIEELEEMAEVPPTRAEARVPKVEMVPPRPGALETLRAWLDPILDPVATAGLVAVFAVFMLLQREDLRDRLIRIVGDGDVSVTTRILDDAAGRVSRYLVTTTLLNAAHGAAIWGGLHLLGFPNAFLWGLLSMLLRFVPYLGPWIAASLPIALSLAIFEGWTPTLLTLGLFVSIELVSNNVLEPWLYGQGTGLSPFGVILAAVFWAWLWGAIGLLLAIPFTVCLVVLGRHVPRLGVLSVLLGEAPALAPELRLYQRLLADDADEAAELVARAVEESSFPAMLDTLAVPALKLLAREASRGTLDERRESRVRACLAEIVSEARGEIRAEEDAEAAAVSPSSEACRVHVVCVPARDANDAVAASWLAEVLAERGFRATSPGPSALQGEWVDVQARQDPEVVCISALSPGAAQGARHLARRLGAGRPEREIVVGAWCDGGAVERARGRSDSDAARWVATFGEAVEVLSGVADRLSARKASQGDDSGARERLGRPRSSFGGS